MGFRPEFSTDFGCFSIFELLKFHAQLSRAGKSFITSGPGVYVGILIMLIPNIYILPGHLLGNSCSLGLRFVLFVLVPDCAIS